MKSFSCLSSGAKRLSPIRVSDTVWFFIDHGSLQFVVECRDVDGYHRTIQFKITRSKLLKALTL